jgi:hypothetical protein
LIQKKKVELKNSDEDVLQLNAGDNSTDSGEEKTEIVTGEKNDIKTKTIDSARERVDVEPENTTVDEVPVESQSEDTSKINSPSSNHNTFSIKETLKTVGNLQEEKNESDDSAEGNEKLNEVEKSIAKEIDTEAVMGIWNEFVDSLRNKQPRMHSALRALQPGFSEGNTIKILFRNNAQVADFKENTRSLLADFIRDKLEFEDFTIEADVFHDEKEPKVKFLTEKDRLKHMTSKNQALQKLKQEFNLDFE